MVSLLANLICAAWLHSYDALYLLTPPCQKDQLTLVLFIFTRSVKSALPLESDVV
ncbi:hypothetical protein BP63_58 [Salmonella phage BP63]|uniref:Uncharacterized protein n=2 Tax=Rosemountvirus TaxID=2733127 RepID=A0A140XG89_9CAUD|nr:hypothetical protein BJD50_gp58 [Salmonella phage BP63]AIT13879.1 hypothetical protein BP63_58 [Salmonella phage BP63]